MKKITKGAKIIVLSGDYKGQVGNVEKVIGDKVWIERVNMVVRHQKNPQEKGKGFKLNKNMPLFISKVALLDSKKQKKDQNSNLKT